MALIETDIKFQSYVEENKSKFYGFIIKTDSVDNFKAELEAIKKEHSKAKHVVYAYIIGSASKSTDDKEPKGTAGRPLLELLHKKGINNTAIVVVRYFGGSKLGVGKLLRTYLQAGIKALENA